MNSEWEKGKVLVQVGGILSLSSFLGSSLFLTSGYLIGLFLQIFGLKKICKEISEKRVFYFYLFSIFLKILTLIVLFVGLYYILGKLLFLYGISEGFRIEWISKTEPLKFILLIIICWFLISLSGFFYFKTFKKIGEKTDIDYFSKGAKISFLGTMLYILIVGFFLDLLGQIFVVVGYFSLPQKYPSR